MGKAAFVAMAMLLGATPAPVRTGADSEVPAPPAEVRATAIPPRAPDAPSGSEFAKRTLGWEGRRRQAAAIQELLAGNVPESFRLLRPVTLTGQAKGSPVASVIIWVMPDYLAIGSDEDFLYMPLTLPSATAIANAWGFVLPTRKIVDAVYARAEHRLEPIPMEPGPKMRSSVYYLRHQELINEQRAGIPAGALVSGHKKDVVITNRLLAKAGRIAIYGWHRRKDDPIQPLSTVHEARYADYSHGARLVWNHVWAEGELRSIFEVLSDPRLAAALTYEGTIRSPRKLMNLKSTETDDS